jgi:hypothetical protein
VTIELMVQEAALIAWVDEGALYGRIGSGPEPLPGAERHEACHERQRRQAEADRLLHDGLARGSARRASAVRATPIPINAAPMAAQAAAPMVSSVGRTIGPIG